MQNLQCSNPNELIKVKKKEKKNTEMLDMLLLERNGYARIHLCNFKIDGHEGKTVCEKNMCFAGFAFVCFVFVSVFISEEGEPSWVCQAPVSMQAIISPTPLKSMYVWGNVHVLRAHPGVWCTDRGRCYVHFALWLHKARARYFGISCIAFRLRISGAFGSPKLNWQIGWQSK